MAATSSKMRDNYFLLLTFLVSSISIVTPVFTLVEFETPVHLFNQKSNVSLWCKFKEEDVNLVNSQKKNFSVYINGSVEENVTLEFNFKKDTNVLKPLANITLAKGAVNETYSRLMEAINVGHTVVLLNSTLPPPNMSDVEGNFMQVSVSHSKSLVVISDIVGWVYFVAWSVSFYPQTYINWRRKSVIGLHFDFLSLNILGFFMYSIFNVCMYWVDSIQSQYFKRHPYGVNPVQLNDVIFSLHAFFACIIQVIQCLVYERGDQQVSRTAKCILGVLGAASVVMVILGGVHVVLWLDFLYFVSYVKLFITLIKYIPQAYYNYRRKSTSGWSIGNILLDCTGGTLSIVQMFILAYNYHDWSSIFGDPTKFGLGIFSVIFDVFFMVQHYCFYRGNDVYRRDLSSPQPTHSSLLTESVSSVDYGATGISH